MTEDYPLERFTITEDQTIDNSKTYYSYSLVNNDYRQVINPINANISSYYEREGIGLTINGHTPAEAVGSLLQSNYPWREIIGNKFGVDSEGNLYASDAHIEGNIVASSLTIKGSDGSQYNGLTAIESNRYFIEIRQESIEESNEESNEEPNDNGVLLQAILYYNGVIVSSAVSNNFKWYNIDDNINDPSLGTPGATFLGEYEQTYKVIYKIDDNTIINQIITPTKSEKISKYITDIGDGGITIHPANGKDNFYVQHQWHYPESYSK